MLLLYRKKGIETHLVNRYEYGAEAIDWADAIICAGGDGTFLLGASKLRDATKPIIGINTDPRRYVLYTPRCRESDPLPSRNLKQPRINFDIVERCASAARNDLSRSFAQRTEFSAAFA